MMDKISKHFVGLDRSWQLYLALSLSCFLMAFLLSQGELQRQRAPGSFCAAVSYSGRQ